MIEKIEVIVTKAVELFKYQKLNNGYWDKLKLYKQVIYKILSITEVLYPDYLFLFLFNNITSYHVFVQNALRIA